MTRRAAGDCPAGPGTRKRLLVVLAAAMGAGVPAEGEAAPTLVRSFVDDEYNPEYSTLVVVDAATPDGSDRGGPRGEGALSFHRRTNLPSIAISGEGWLTGRARDGFHDVHLELHRGPPADDRAQWHEVVETPYRSRTGRIGLAMLMSATSKP